MTAKKAAITVSVSVAGMVIGAYTLKYLKNKGWL